MSEIELLFLGSGTSAGIPMIGCHCPVCTSSDPRDRRSRPSVLISYGSANVLVDAAPELRLQCLANNISSIDAVVFTHAHADHIMGLDDVRRFNTLSGRPLNIFADEPTHKVLHCAFGYAFREPDPTELVYRPHLLARTISGPFQIGGRQWTPIPLLHGNLPVLGFRVGNLAYCTDVSAIPESSLELLKSLEILVLDGLQSHPHPTPQSNTHAGQKAPQHPPRRTYLTHIAHHVSHAAASGSLPEGVELAYDGLRVGSDGG